MLIDLLQQGAMLACCSVVVSEVYAGLRPGEEQRTAELLESLLYYEVNYAVAKRAGLYKRDYGKRGSTLSLTDCTMAAVAVENHLTLITDNVRNFPMKELSLFPFPATN
jgi:predicted nucleic acid-binding protein